MNQELAQALVFFMILGGFVGLIVSILAFRRTTDLKKDQKDLSGASLNEIRSILGEVKGFEKDLPDKLDQAATRVVVKIFGDNPEKILQDSAAVALLVKMVSNVLDADDLPEDLSEAIDAAATKIVTALMANPPAAFVEKFQVALLEKLDDEIGSIAESIVTNEDGWEDSYDALMKVLETEAPKLLKAELDNPDSALREQLMESLSEHLSDKL